MPKLTDEQRLKAENLNLRLMLLESKKEAVKTALRALLTSLAVEHGLRPESVEIDAATGELRGDPAEPKDEAPPPVLAAG